MEEDNRYDKGDKVQIFDGDRWVRAVISEVADGGYFVEHLRDGVLSVRYSAKPSEIRPRSSGKPKAPRGGKRKRDDEAEETEQTEQKSEEQDGKRKGKEKKARKEKKAGKENKKRRKGSTDRVDAKSKPKIKAKTKAKKRIKDPNEPKRPLSAYLQFAVDARAKIKRDQPHLGPSATMSAIGIAWRLLTPEDKSVYDQSYRTQVDQYKIALGMVSCFSRLCFCLIARVLIDQQSTRDKK
jgi:structure-specific recognition protein 1